MASRYVIAKTSGYVDLTFPTGTVRQHIAAGHRYLAAEAGVKQRPELFRPWERGDPIPGPSAAPTRTAA
jgi:hypothetical protein